MTIFPNWQSDTTIFTVPFAIESRRMVTQMKPLYSFGVYNIAIDL